MAQPKCWQELSTELLDNIFKLLPEKDKLQAGLACKPWQLRADAACMSITLLGGRAGHLQALLQRWMPRRGHAVHALCLQLQRDQGICQWLQLQLQLPSQLNSLQLLGWTFSALPLAPTAPSYLTKLVLQQQTLGAPAAPAAAPAQLLLDALHNLTSLQHLSISINDPTRGDLYRSNMFDYPLNSGSSSTLGLLPVLEAVASSWQHLTSLELRGMRQPQAHPQQPGLPHQVALQQQQQPGLQLHVALQQQQQLLPAPAGLQLGGWALQQQQQLGWQDGAPAQQQQQQQYLAQLTKLQELTLELPDSRCLGGIEQIHSLTKLSLVAQSYSLQPLLSQGDSSSIGRLTNLRSLSLEGGSCSAHALSNITSLTSLTLTGNTWDAALWGWLERLSLLESLSFASRVAGGGGDAAAYAALTASSSLQQLDLSTAILPQGVWQHIFQDGWELRRLHSLCLPSQGGKPLQAGDVQALVCGCTALKHLDGAVVLPFTPALTSLTQLTYLGTTQARLVAHAAQLGKMTQLQQYKLTVDSERKQKRRCCDFQHLHKLPHLTRLELAGGTLSLGIDGPLHQLTGLAELTVPSLSEAQLLDLAWFLPGLTSLSCSTGQLGVLLVDRLVSLDPNSFDLQQRALDRPWDARVRHLRSHIPRITIVSKAPAGAPSDIVKQLQRCFTYTITQISQEQANLNDTIAMQQAQQRLKAEIADVARQGQEQQQQIAGLRQQLEAAESFIDADKTVLRDQLAKEKAQWQELHAQLKDGQGANQALQLQLQNQQEANRALQSQLGDAQAANQALQLQLQNQQAANQALQRQLAQLQ